MLTVISRERVVDPSTGTLIAILVPSGLRAQQTLALDSPEPGKLNSGVSTPVSRSTETTHVHGDLASFLMTA